MSVQAIGLQILIFCTLGINGLIGLLQLVGVKSRIFHYVYVVMISLWKLILIESDSFMKHD